MLGLRSLVATASLVACVIAQNVAFTSVPAVVVAGESYNITWGGGDGESVTLTLRRGDPENLSTVATIADNISGDHYVWTVDKSLQTASDYALQITQGQSDINYSGLFTVSGGTGSSSIPGTSTMTSGNATAPITAATVSGTGTAMSRNTTFSTASLTKSSSFTFAAATSTSPSSSSTAAATQSTSAPSNDAPTKFGSSAALVLGIVAAVMLH